MPASSRAGFNDGAPKVPMIALRAAAVPSVAVDAGVQSTRPQSTTSPGFGDILLTLTCASLELVTWVEAIGVEAIGVEAIGVEAIGVEPIDGVWPRTPAMSAPSGVSVARSWVGVPPPALIASWYVL